VIGFISVLSLYLSQSALYAMQILSVRPSVGLFVCHTRDLCKNGWTYRQTFYHHHVAYGTTAALSLYNADSLSGLIR